MLSLDDRRPGPAIPDTLNLAQHVLFSSGTEDDKLALVVVSPTGAKRWSYGQLREAVLATAGGIAERMAVGARLLMRIGNQPDFPIIYLGAIAAGVLPVPTSAALGEREITKLADVLAPDAVVHDGAVTLPAIDAPLVTPDALLSASPIDPVMTPAEEPAYIVFTSGTGAEPKGVVHAHRAILARQMMFEGWYGLEPGDRVLHAGAFNWTYTLGTGLLDPWTRGATAIVLEEGTSLDALPLLAKRHDATIIAGAPGVFRRLVRSALPKMPKLRHGLSAGEKLPETVRASWKDTTGTDLHEAFGQSECSTFISGSPAAPAPSDCLGRAQDGRAIAILGDDGPVVRGEIGRIAVHTSDPGLMLGYLGDKTTPLEQEWFPTGDLGLMRDDGWIEYHGRADDLLTAGGFRVSPIEVETAMLLHPGIEEAAAIDRAVSGDTTVIALHYTSPQPLTEAELRAHADTHLAQHKTPRLFIHEQTLPRNANGKLLRKALRAANEGVS